MFLGPPGAGKGTQAQRVAGHLGLVHLATGDMLRQAVAEGTELGRRARGIMEAGDLVPDELVIAMLLERLGRSEARAGFILDGFPRTVAQAEALEAKLGPEGLDLAVLFQVPQGELVERLLQRGRSDDTEATVCRRLQVYHEQTEPLIAFYRQRHRLQPVRGQGTKDAVERRLLELLR